MDLGPGRACHFHAYLDPLNEKNAIYVSQYYVRRDFAVAVMIIATVVCYFTVFVFESYKATAQLGLVSAATSSLSSSLQPSSCYQ